jgi:rod shape-determining protein MreD
VKTFLSSAIALLAILLVETAILSNWYILPVVPDLLMITVLYIAYTNGSMIGQTTGFFSGLILDFASASPLGLHALIRTILGFIFGRLHQTVTISGILIPMIVGFVATLLKAILLMVVSFFYPSGIDTYFSTGTAFFSECLLNSIMTPVMFKFLASFSVFKEENETGLIK